MYPSNYKQQNRYDPFSFHQNNLKRVSNYVTTADSRTAFEQEAPQYNAHYTDSRTFSSAVQPSYTFKDSIFQRLSLAPSLPQVPLRHSLSWKSSKNPDTDDNGGGHLPEYEPSERIYSHNSHRRKDVQSVETPYSSSHVRAKAPSSSGYFPSYQDDYYVSQETTTTERPKLKSNFPKRDYFPSSDSSFREPDDPESEDISYLERLNSNQKPPPREENSYDDRWQSLGTKYVGDPTLLNAGIVVTDPVEDIKADLVSSYNERYGWSNSGRVKETKKRDSAPPAPSGLNTWTSLDVAKPQWEEQVWNQF